MSELKTVARATSGALDRRQIRSDERAERIEIFIRIIRPAAVYRMLGIGHVVDAKQLLTEIRRAEGLECSVVPDSSAADRAAARSSRQAIVAGSKPDHLTVYVCESSAVSGYAICRDYIPGSRVASTETGGSICSRAGPGF